jgi:hypothetical protein
MQMTVEEAAMFLGVRVDDSIDAVRAEYRRRLFEVHPDHGGHSDDTRRLILALDALERAHANRSAIASLGGSSVSVSPPEPTPDSAGNQDVEVDAAVDGECVWRVDTDTLALPLPAEETYARLVDVAHRIGDVTYVDRQCGVLEALLRTRAGTTVSMVISLQGRANESTEAFFTLEPIDAVRGDLPSVLDITELVASYLQASAT